MNSDQWPYVELYDRMRDYEGERLFSDLLQPWLDQNGEERRWLDELGNRRGSPVPPADIDEIQRLYALSRIVDVLQLSFQPRAPDAGWNFASVGRDEFDRFMTGLGLERIDRPGFHPFFHEIVTVDEAPDENASPEIVDVCWPGYMLGPLLISRAGVCVRAGRRHLAKEIAETSLLYWAYARNHRPSTDLSRGWGSNSQWRTAFRRDYALDGALHYNVGATQTPFAMDEDLDERERMELLRHRCFVTSRKPGDDRWPYGLTLVESA